MLYCEEARVWLIASRVIYRLQLRVVVLVVALANNKYSIVLSFVKITLVPDDGDCVLSVWCANGCCCTSDALAS
jgi:hypothetical protein